MVDPTSDLCEDVDEESAPACATCGTKIVRAPTHRVVTWVHDSTAQHRHFCDEACREAWDDDRP
ncbi:MAG: DUF7576 family protein [Halobacteriota archaeon]